MTLDKEKVVPAVIIVLVLGLVIWFGFVNGRPANVSENVGTNTPEVSPTRALAPQNVVVPEKGATNVPENVAVPQIVAPASTITSASFRIFNITINKDEFIPNTVIVRAGDAPKLIFTAVDKDYDFTQPDYGLRDGILISKGQTKSISIGSTIAGKFTFYCKRCGGPEKGPIGYIIVSSK